VPADAVMPPPALPGWLEQEMPFRRAYVRTRAGRLHVVDQGEGPAVLLCHGNPTWSYLWRNVIPLVAEAGFRVIAPDLFGFGLSDKPPDPSDHQLRAHGQAIADVLHALELDRVIVVGQDWGGPIAVAATRLSDATATGFVFGNTAVVAPARPFRSKPFHKLSHVPGLSDAVFVGAGFPLGALSRVQGDRKSIGKQEQRAYWLPFKRFRDRAGPLGLARMVPNAESHPSTAECDDNERWLLRHDVPTTLLWGRRDPILGGSLGRHRRLFPNARVIETTAGHFSQEEVPERWADAIVEVGRQAGSGAAKLAS
jgi:pimeloyl-ACP methyl ester carboxylesterase